MGKYKTNGKSDYSEIAPYEKRRKFNYIKAEMEGKLGSKFIIYWKIQELGRICREINDCGLLNEHSTFNISSLIISEINSLEEDLKKALGLEYYLRIKTEEEEYWCPTSEE